MSIAHLRAAMGGMSGLGADRAHAASAPRIIAGLEGAPESGAGER